MYTTDLNSQIKEVDNAEKEAIRTAINIWKGLEQETLGKLLAPPESQASENATDESPSDD